jgi:hypothetical protein
MKSLRFELGTLWCKSMHPAPMWPAHGHYRCPTCLRSYPVPWEHPPAAPAADRGSMPGAVVQVVQTSAATAAAASH